MANEKRPQGYGSGERNTKKKIPISSRDSVNPVPWSERSEANAKAAQKLEKKLIPKEKRERLDKFMRAAHRSDKAWEEIIEILRSGNLLTFEPSEAAQGIRSIKGILYNEERLIAFTTVDRMIDYYEKCYGEAADMDRVKVRGIELDEILDVANEKNIQFWIDPASRKMRRLFPQYTPKTEMIEAVLAL